MESSKALRAALLLAVSALFLSSTAALPRAASTPFLAETSRTYWIGYYDTGVLGPMLSIRGYLNGSPVPISVSLFMYTPRAIYAIGHYYGEGSVDINLTGSLVRYIAGKWRRDDGWPSLLAFVDYLSNDTVRTAILAVPYNPSWLLNGDKILITIAVNFSNIKPLPWPKAVRRPNITSTPASSTRNASGDPYGYTYLGSCMGNTSLDVYIQGNEPDIPDQWVLESCYEFEGPFPLFYVAWGSGVWNNGVTSISINTFGANYAETGSGFYASYAIYNSTGYYVISAASAEPTWSFPQDTNIGIYSPLCGGIAGAISVVPGNSLGASCANGVPIYTVPGSGVLYLGPVSDIAAVTFYDCAVQTGVCTPIYIANGTMVLDVTSYSSGNLYLYPYIDVGNGTITATLSYLIGQGLAGSAFTLLDGQNFYYNPGIGYVVETSPCSNAPAPTQVTTSSVNYVLQNVINSYKAGIPGWAADVGGAIVEYLAEAVLEDPLLSHLVGFAASYLLSYLESSTASIYQTYAVRVMTSPPWGFYVTFVGTQAVETGNGASNWPMGVVINGTGYYLYYSLGEQCQT